MNFGQIFRVLRPDEGPILPNKRVEVKPRHQLNASFAIDNAVERHLLYGSQPDYVSNLVSCTAELFVALSFGGCISRIVQTNKIPESVRYKRLDKKYLQDSITDKIAQKRSRRSDEILIADPLEFSILPVSCISMKRTLTPGNMDDSEFPTPEQLLGVLSPENVTKRLGGPNKRLFEIEVEGRKFIIRTPRPNYCLEHDVLFGEELAELCKCEFRTFGAYRLLSPSLVPRCAMYEMCLQYELNGEKKTFPWSFLLLEHFELVDFKKDELKSVALQLFAPDIILCNWACRLKEEELMKGSEAVYARKSSDGSIIRISVDKSLGCTYPEDKQKGAPIFSFSDDPGAMVNSFRNDDVSRWAYGNLCQKAMDEAFMKVLEQSDNFYGKLSAVFDVASARAGWPPFDSSHSQSVWSLLNQRMQTIRSRLPFHKMDLTKSLEKPRARDGHAAKAFNDAMFVLGGNSARGPLDDIWKLDTKELSWTRLQCVIPNGGRYSFSSDLYKGKYIILFGGETKRGFTDEVLAFNLLTEAFVNVVESGKPPIARCRHSSFIKGDELIITGGFSSNSKKLNSNSKRFNSNSKKLNSISKGLLKEIAKSDGSFEVEIAWQEHIGKMKKYLHRHHTFPVGDSFAVVGGFGQSLMKINEYDVNTLNPKITFTARDILLTSTQRSLLESDEENEERQNNMKQPQVSSSKSLAGFASVYDEVHKRLVIFGGDSVSHVDSSEHSQSGSFGRFTKAAGNAAKIYYLEQSVDDTTRTKEYFWRIDSAHESLGEEFKLPNFSGRSACLFQDNSVLLFGGRFGDLFSDEVYIVNLNPEMGAGLSLIDQHIRDLKRMYEEQPERNRDKVREEIMKQITQIFEG